MFSLSGNADVHLGNLPRNIVRRIVKIGIESVDNMRLVSPRWDALAVEHLEGNRKYFPKLDKFIWGVDQSGQKTVTVRIPVKYRNYFGFAEWHGPQRSQLYSRSLLPHSEFAARLVKRCSSIDFAQIALGPSYRNEEIDALSAIMQGVPIVEAQFDVSGNLIEGWQNTIQYFVRSHKVQRLCLTTNFSTVFDIYFLELLNPGRIMFFLQALLTAKSVELAVKTPLGMCAALVEKYNRCAAELTARRVVINLNARTEPTEDGEFRIRITVTRDE